MNLTSRASLRKDVMQAEGLRLKPYRDTVGKLTIGYGRNLDDNGITQTEAEVLLDHDLYEAEKSCIRHFEWFEGLSELRQRVVAEMVFNLGLAKFKEFKRTIAAIKAKDYQAAAQQMLESKWASQVGIRAKRLAEWMRDGH